MIINNNNNNSDKDGKSRLVFTMEVMMMLMRTNGIDARFCRMVGGPYRGEGLERKFCSSIPFSASSTSPSRSKLFSRDVALRVHDDGESYHYQFEGVLVPPGRVFALVPPVGCPDDWALTSFLPRLSVSYSSSFFFVFLGSTNI